MFDLDWIRRLIEMLDESDVDTLELSRLGTRIVLSKSPPVTARLALADPPSLDAGSPAPTEPEEDLVEIHSPMVGTFYRAPAPDAPPYVEVGDRVNEGQTLCILEAMKLMNELESEVAGVIRQIPAQDAEPVEYGQVLFRVALDGTG
jgi:acetyl-CoA carboxylase biotin carboxyl carrier protein